MRHTRKQHVPRSQLSACIPGKEKLNVGLFGECTKGVDLEITHLKIVQGGNDISVTRVENCQKITCH